MIQLKHRFNFNILIMITISLGVLMRSFWYLKALFCKEIQELHPGSDIRYPKPQMHGGPPQVFLGLSYSFPRWWCHLRLPPGILLWMSHPLATSKWVSNKCLKQKLPTWNPRFPSSHRPGPCISILLSLSLSPLSKWPHPVLKPQTQTLSLTVLFLTCCSIH